MRTPIPSLTGLRFLAAACVVISHALPGVIPLTGTPPVWYALLGAASGLGMTLFFVLSGFVIHYNYFSSIKEDGTRGILNFWAARFARLYPLYIALLVLELAHYHYLGGLFDGNGVLPRRVSDALPYYIFMTQSWFYLPNSHNALIYQFGPISAISWSISTEWFFYLVYPLICIGVGLISTIHRTLVAALLLCVTTFAVLSTAFAHATDINQYALAHYGEIAAIGSHWQDSYFRWLIYFSPYSRLAEFVLGCLTASAYMSLRDVKASAREERLGLLALLLALAGTIALHSAMFGPLHFLTTYHMSFGFAPTVAIIIFCCARYRNAIVGALSSRNLVICGDASYSLYLLHIAVIGAFGAHLIPVSSFGVNEAARLAFTLFAAVGLSLVTYAIWEVPARRVLRRLLTLDKATSVRRAYLGAWWAAVIVFAGVLPLLFVAKSTAKVTLPTATIDVLSATYGGNCSAPANNALEFATDVCSGKTDCRFTVNVKTLGDPAAGCGKDFHATWRCIGSEETRSVTLSPEAGSGKVALLSCPALRP